MLGCLALIYLLTSVDVLNANQEYFDQGQDHWYLPLPRAEELVARAHKMGCTWATVKKVRRYFRTKRKNATRLLPAQHPPEPDEVGHIQAYVAGAQEAKEGLGPGRNAADVRKPRASKKPRTGPVKRLPLVSIANRNYSAGE